MALPTISTLNGAGSSVTVNTLNSGRQAATDSAAVVWSNEDKAALDAMVAAMQDTSTPSPVDTVRAVAGTNRSAAVGTAAAQIAPANATRRGLILQNQSASATIYVNLLAAATADRDSLMLPPGAYWESPATWVGTGAVSAIATATGTPLYAREY